MKKICLIFVVLCLVGCGSSNKRTEKKDKFVAENLQNLDAEDLAKAYPEATIYEDKGMFEEGTVERAYSVLYPDTENELHITWKTFERKEIHDIRFSKEGQWKSAEGIKIGTTYEALNALNGKEISFYGFGWDYGGAVMWNNGNLENSNLRVFLAPQEDIPNKFYGDREIKATPEEIKALDLRVNSMMLVN